MIRYCTMIVLLTILGADAYAQWSSNPAANNPICTELRNQRLVRAISDGKGGAIMTWEDERSGPNVYDVYAQRIDADGNIRWGMNGKAICTIVGSQNKPQLCTDDKGGAYIVWKDVRFANNDIFLQHVDSNGTLLYPTEGFDLVPNTIKEKEQSDPVICRDGDGGCYVAFMDNVPGGNFDNQIMLIRVAADGTVPWSSAGYVSPIVPQSGMYQYSPSICYDGNKGCYVAWQWFLGGASGQYDLYIQGVAPNGRLYWPGNGKKLCDAAGNQGYPYVDSDGLGGAVTTWADFRAAKQVVYTQRMDAAGDGKWPGGPITTAGGVSDHPSIVGMGNGSAVVVWEDFRGGSTCDVYAQFLDANGAAKWTANGVPVCTAPNNQYTPYVVQDGQGGVLIAWEDRRNGSLNGDIYIQRLDANGTALWPANGIVVSSAPNTQSAPTIVASDEGSAIVAWEDYRVNYSNAGIFAFKVLKDGTYPRSQPGMSLSSKSVDFGILGVGAKRDRVVAMTNTGGDTLHITSITSSSPDFAPRPTNHVLASGTMFNDTIRFTPTEMGLRSGFIVVQSDSWTSPDTIRVSGTGTGTAVMDVPSKRFSFGYVRLTTFKDTNVVFTNSGLDTLKITAANASNSAMTISPGVAAIPPGKSLTQRIRYTPKVPGTINARIVLLSNAPSSPDTLFLTGIGFGEVDVMLTPQSIAFGKVTVGQRKDSLIDVKNGGTDTLRVYSIDSDDAAFTAIPSTFQVAPLATYKLRVRCVPTRLGMVSGELLMNSNSITTPDKLTLTANGDADVALAPASIAFGPVEVTKYRDTVVLIQNKKPDTLFVTAVTSDNPAFTAVPSSFYVAPGLVFADTIRFAPTTIGTINGIISFVSNSASTPDKLTVTGEGRQTNGIAGPPAEISGFTLLQNYPNPFTTSTVIPYTLHRAARVTLYVENILGQSVAVLVNGQQEAGEYQQHFNTASLPAGMYRFVLSSSGHTASGWMQILR